MEKVPDFIQESLPAMVHPKKPRVWMVMIPLLTALLLLVLFAFVHMSKEREERYELIEYSTEESLILDDKDNNSISDYLRLPKSIRPVQYKLHIIPHLEEIMNFTMEGHVQIIVQCLERTDTIVLHSKNLTINESSVTVSDNFSPRTWFTVKNHTYDAERDFYEITLNEPLRQYAIYILNIDFVATINDQLHGFYRSSYVDKATNETRWLGVTQFEPTYARQAFPCFDEPLLKAEFEVSIARKDNMTSISNMALRRTESFPGMEGWSWDHYEKSLPMSTYLVAFVVSDLTFKESSFAVMSGERKRFRVWARHDAINQTEYALRIGPKLIEFFETYFNLDFPLPKMDMVAVPDFDDGAMENWGLVVFKEVEMLYDPASTSKSAKNRIASTITHELSHQWFGNLVTMSWWSDLWLNEGFATYFEYIGVNHIEPTWNEMQLMINDDVEDVMQVDVLDSSHPISTRVEDPDQINEIFDTITYSKGASVIGMLDNFLSPSTFRTGLQRYLMQWRYGNTVPDDLWRAFTEAAHDENTLVPELTVSEIMKTWTLQIGFPVVKITRNFEARKAVFSQTKFRIRPLTAAQATEESSHPKWWIPISYATPRFNSNFTSGQPQFWLSKKTASVEEYIPAEEKDWFIANVNQTGFYRVNYDMRNWELISNQLKVNSSQISLLNRAQIIDDTLNLARSSMLSYDFVFTLITYLRHHENELSPWDSFLDGISHLMNMLDSSAAYGNFQSYLRHLIEIQYELIDFEDNADSTLQKDLHSAGILECACVSLNQDCINRSRNYFDTWSSAPNPDQQNPVPINLRKPFYCAMAANGNDTWNFLWERYIASNTQSEKKYLMRGMACSKNLTTLKTFSEMAVTDGSGIRKQDGNSVLKEIAFNPQGTELVFRLLNEKWDSISEYLSSLDTVLDAIGSQFNTADQLTQLKNFRTKYESNLGPNQRAVNEAIERVEANIEWMQNHYEEVSALLQTYVDGFAE